MIFIYRFFYLLVRFLLVLSQPFLSKKIKTWMLLRSNQEWKKITFKQALWFHASSGEIEYCKAVITEIKKISPSQKIIISYSSPSAEKLLFNIKDQVDFIFPLPWDSASVITAVIDHIHPRALIFSRTDFWAELIIQNQKRNIPVMAISMFPRLNAVTRFLYRWLLKDFAFITTVNSTKSLELEKTLQRPVETFSDTRFDQVLLRLEGPSKITFSSNTPRVVFASTWPADENIVFKCIPELIKQNYQVILAPHEISRAQKLMEKLQIYRPALLSHCKNLLSLQLNSSLLIVDQVGYLADIYRGTDWAFVGGSFDKKIHSVMEPLAAENIVFFGPHFYNNPEAIETQKQGLTFLVKSEKEILQLIQTQSAKERASHKNKLKEFTQKQRGSSRLIAQKILNLLQD